MEQDHRRDGRPERVIWTQANQFPFGRFWPKSSDERSHALWPLAMATAPEQPSDWESAAGSSSTRSASTTCALEHRDRWRIAARRRGTRQKRSNSGPNDLIKATITAPVMIAAERSCNYRQEQIARSRREIERPGDELRDAGQNIGLATPTSLRKDRRPAGGHTKPRPGKNSFGFDSTVMRAPLANQRQPAIRVPLPSAAESQRQPAPPQPRA